MASLIADLTLALEGQGNYNTGDSLEVHPLLVYNEFGEEGML